MHNKIVMSMLCVCLCSTMAYTSIDTKEENKQLNTEISEAIKADVAFSELYSFERQSSEELLNLKAEKVAKETTGEVTEGTEVEEPLEIFNLYATTDVNIRRSSDINSEVIGAVYFNSCIECTEFNNAEWYRINYGEEGYGYVSKQYFSNTEAPYTNMSAPNNSGFKSYMPYAVNGGSIFSSSSRQYLLQTTKAYDGNYGIRMVNNRYCVAIGSYFTTDIGVYFDLILENGTVIPCVLADAKADQHTDSNNAITVHDGSIAEFITNCSLLPTIVRGTYGDVSYATEEWKSKVSYVRLYQKNCLE